MKKRRVITAFLLVAFLLMGASYAAWSDTLVLDHNVTTGTLDVDWNPDDPNSYENLFNMNGPTVHPSCTMQVVYPVDDADILSVTVNNMYPGIAAYVRVWQQNTGTLPAKFGGVTVDTSGSTQGALANIYYNMGVYIHRSSGTFEFLGYYNGLVTGVQASLNSLLAGKVLYPGDLITTEGDSEGQVSYLYLPYAAPNDAQGQSLNFDISFTWVQP